MTSKPYLDDLAVAKKAVEIARENPDFVYKVPDEGACVYVEDRESSPRGSCLFGQALLALGANPDEIPEDVGIVPLLHQMRNGEADWDWGRQTQLQKEMSRTQGAQDGGDPWWSAISGLENHLARLEGPVQTSMERRGW